MTDAPASRRLPDSKTRLEAPAGYAIDAQEVQFVQTVSERVSLAFAFVQELLQLARREKSQPSLRRWNGVAVRGPC